MLDADTMRPDPGDRALLELANAESRVLVTIDTDFGELIFLHQMAHTGLVRLPDVPAHRRIELMAEIISRYGANLENHAIVTVRGNRIRLSTP